MDVKRQELLLTLPGFQKGSGGKYRKCFEKTIAGCEFSLCAAQKKNYFIDPLSDGVMVAQSSLEALVMVRIHVGQPLQIFNVYNSFLPSPALFSKLI